MFALEGPPHQYCPRDSAFKRGMGAPTLGNLCYPLNLTSGMCYCHHLGGRKNKAQFAEEQNAPMGVPALSLHKAWGRSHPATALFCSGPQWSLKRSSSELVHYSITQ